MSHFDDFVDVDGYRFGYRIEHDPDYGPPWQEHDGHGPVSEWRHGKRAGELVLSSDRHGYQRLYDFQAAVKLARTEWGCKSRREAAEAARRDFEYLRGWCMDRWHWCGVVVELVNEDGEPMGEDSQAVWGIESDAYAYHADVAAELGAEIIRQLAAKGGAH